MELGLSERTIHILVTTFDEDYSGAISLEEYYFGLEAYNINCEGVTPFSDKK